jgi:multidrug resistance efflux pump
MKTRMQFIPLVIIIAVLGLGAYWLVNHASAQEQGLKASGTIEATDVTIAPELGGRVVEVLVSDGDAVSKDQAVVRLDDTLLQAQLRQVEANIQAVQAQQRAAQAQQHAAQANYDLLKSGPIAEQIQAAQQAVNTAAANVAAAEAQLAQLKAGARSGDIAAAEAAIAQTAAQLKVATDLHDKTMTCVNVPGRGEVCPALGEREEQARASMQAAQEAYAAAVARLKQIKSGATKNELDAAQARVDAAKAQKDMAQVQLE